MLQHRGTAIVSSLADLWWRYIVGLQGGTSLSGPPEEDPEQSFNIERDSSKIRLELENTLSRFKQGLIMRSSTNDLKFCHTLSTAHTRSSSTRSLQGSNGAGQWRLTTRERLFWRKKSMREIAKRSLQRGGCNALPYPFQGPRPTDRNRSLACARQGKSVQCPEHIWFSKPILDYNVGGFASESIYMEYKW